MPRSNPKAESRRVVVVGNGMVAHRFCDRLTELDRTPGWDVVVLGEEPRLAYDRVHLSELFSGRSADELLLGDDRWFAERDVVVRVSTQVTAINRSHRTVTCASGLTVSFDALILATGSAPMVPPLPGTDLPGVFVYRTIEDVEAIKAWASHSRRVAVIGGGLLGLEAAKAVRDLGLETHVVEMAPRLMPRQVDDAGGEVLRRAIERLGVHVHVGVRPQGLRGTEAVDAVLLEGRAPLDVDMVVISAGIRPRDELARAAGLAVGERGGIVVDSSLRTSDPAIFAIGECALVHGMIYGLVAPGYTMADTAAAVLTGGEATFTGADMSTKLKLLGVDVASFGDAFADMTAGSEAQRVIVEDEARGLYQKLVLTADGSRLLGGVLVGDASAFTTLLDTCRRGLPIPERPLDLLVGSAKAVSAESLSDDSQVCACNNVTRGAICRAIGEMELTSVSGIKGCTRAGTGCGGCLPMLATLLESELARAGLSVKRQLCEHFAYTRQELFEIVKLGRIRGFAELLATHGQGGGCEVCRPAVASILASTWNDFILDHPSIQDTNDRFLANIQRGGTYSVIPRVPGGEITPEKLIVLGEVARRFDLYCKITGGQRIDLLGARVEQLPEIWEALIDAGFESGHAYGKALRTVKSCVGSTWCRFGVQDSTSLAIRIEERYRGLRAPHKLKSAVSGCIRECAEAQSKDFGIIATERGWNLYVGGNGGAQPRHAELLASDVDESTLVRLIDRYLMYYIHTAHPLERTARWLERLDGGIDYLRRVVVDDHLGLAASLEGDMQALVDSYACEWTAVVRNPERRQRFQLMADAAAGDQAPPFVRERGQKRPADWPDEAPLPRPPAVEDVATTWVCAGKAADLPHDGGFSLRRGGQRVALFHVAATGAWYATQSVCPHRKDDVLGRGLVGTQDGEPKVACPLHKKTFSLVTGEGLSDPRYCLRTYPVELRGDWLWIQVPAAGDAAVATPAEASLPASRPAIEATLG